MQAFDFELTQRVIFGENSIEKLGELTRDAWQQASLYCNRPRDPKGRRSRESGIGVAK